jgi:hypothetical protein
MSGFMDAMYWSGVRVRVGKSAWLTVQGINTRWFGRDGRAGLCRRLTVQGISTGWFERRGWAGLFRRRGVPGSQAARKAGPAATRKNGPVLGAGMTDDAERGVAVAAVGARCHGRCGRRAPECGPRPRPRQALGRTRAGAAPAVHAETQFAVDRGERQGQPLRVRTLRRTIPRAGCAGARWRWGLPRRLVAAGGGGRTAAG